MKQGQVVNHPAGEQAQRENAAKVVGFLETREALLRVVQQLQAEQADAWLGAESVEARERCHQDALALDRILRRLVLELGLDLGADNVEPGSERAAVLEASLPWRLYQRLEAVVWRTPVERWARGLSRWRARRG